MRTGILAFAAAAVIAAALPLSVPASAEDLGVHVGEGGVGVRVGHEHDRDHWREGRRYGHEGCRTITVKHRTPDGNVVIRKTRRCD
jgi:hypothetical protein